MPYYKHFRSLCTTKSPRIRFHYISRSSGCGETTREPLFTFHRAPNRQEAGGEACSEQQQNHTRTILAERRGIICCVKPSAVRAHSSSTTGVFSATCASRVVARLSTATVAWRFSERVAHQHADGSRSSVNTRAILEPVSSYFEHLDSKPRRLDATVNLHDAGRWAVIGIYIGFSARWTADFAWCCASFTSSFAFRPPVDGIRVVSTASWRGTLHERLGDNTSAGYAGSL
mmetsp:Transcript_18233/g.48995  ORF Transcript_18233/g.48995 Transcript_18233/m.48995 type:complete len:230 (-) Transcript_18233:178-867(-)